MVTQYKNVNCWIFDLDNTLYSPKYNLFPQIDQKMGEYIAHFLKIDFLTAKKLQKQYYAQYGTSLRGLMIHHDMEPTSFLDYVHDIDYSLIPKDELLYQAINRLPGRKIIHTNGTKAHSLKVLKQLDLTHHFEAVFDIIDSDYIPKPHESPYQQLIEKFNIDPKTTVMVEDLAQNLQVPARLGMQTILVYSDDHEPLMVDHNSDFIHHSIDDLGDYLHKICQFHRY